jgi:hypothetical protein
VRLPTNINSGSIRIICAVICISFIAVPSVGTKPLSEWTGSQEDLWLTSVKALDTSLFTYDYNFIKLNNTEWYSFLNYSYKLSKAVVTLVEN